jgi:ABC-type nickel/cobalt efflux system permease component RcnA
MFQLVSESIPLTGFGSALILGLIIGLRHSTDGDHIIAVATMARDYKSLFKGLWVGVSWGLGHSTPLLILGIIILLLKEAVLDFYESVATYFEFGVALMLIFLGLQVFWKIYKGEFHIHDHYNEHDQEEHKHIHGSHAHEVEGDNAHNANKHGPFLISIPFFRLKSYIIGFIHGLAGSAAVMLAILPTTPNFMTGILFLLLFSIGTMISMALFTIVVSAPFVASAKSETTSNVIISIAGVLSIALGCALGSDILFKTDFTGILWY